MRNQTAVKTVALLFCLSLPATAFPWNMSPTNKYAWSENTGWLNFGPTGGGVTVNPTYLAGYLWQQNIGWIKLGADGSGPYGNTGATDWGVNMDSAGNLSGYGWSENMGWINFAPSQGGVTISLVTGAFSGYAWGANFGWIAFQSQPGAQVAYDVSLLSYALTISFSGNGEGVVTSASPPISCNTGYTQQFIENTSLALTANPAQYSLAGVWSGCDSVNGAVCDLNMNSDRNVSVTYSLNTEYTARIDGATPTYYQTLSQAYSAATATGGGVIEVWGIPLNESLTCGAATNVTILGGYDEPNQNESGMTTLISLTIGKGTVTVGGLVIN